MSRKKNNRRLTIRIITLCILFTAAVLLLIFAINLPSITDRFQAREEVHKKPEDLLQQYYTHIKEADYDQMYQLLDEESKGRISQEDFVSRNRRIYEGTEAQNIVLQITGIDDSEDHRVLVSYQVSMDTLAGPISFLNQTLFRSGEQSPKEYAIYWNDSMIFPELTSKDKVQVSLQEAKRGNLLDRNGRLLAGEGVATSVGLVPGKMSEDNAGDMDKLASVLGIPPESITKKLEAKWVNSESFVPIKTVEKLSQLEQISNESDENVRKKSERDAALLSIPGVMLSDTTVRQYPLGAAASHLTGYIQKMTAEDLEKHQGKGYHANSMIGRSGMESLFEDDLKGQNGYEITVVNSEGKTKLVLASIPKQDGKDITLTIDSDLQQDIYNTFAEDKSCTTAMDPYTGEVLALVSTPSYDSNDFILGMSEELWNSLNEDERNPLYNRFRQKLCPGSSFKPITAAVGLKTGAVNPEEDYGNVGLSWQKDSSWGNYHVTTLHAYEPVILKNALIYSDNIYFAKAALKIGKERLQTELDALGFRQKLPFEISVAESQYSNTEQINSEIQLADSGYGQGQMLVNPIHLAALYTGFANQGDILKPYLIYQKNTGREIWLKSAYLPEHAVFIKSAMEQVVQSPQGTGHKAYREDIVLAGKTGTAEIKLTKEDKTGTELGWFGIFTADPNAERPMLLLSMVEDVKGRGGSGYVVEKDKQILEHWFLRAK